MKFDVKVELKFDKLPKAENVAKGQKRLVELVKEKSDPYVPFLTGKLRNEITTSKHIITYKAHHGGSKSYANIQYDTNRGMGKEGLNRGGKRGSEWTERMWNDCKDEITEEIKEILIGGK